jgi:hypothetical protein
MPIVLLSADNFNHPLQYVSEICAQYLSFVLSFYGARCSVVVKVLRYKPEGREFDTR